MRMVAGRNVLLVDSDTTARAEIADLLVGQGYSVNTTDSMGEAQALLRQADVDCAIVDVDLSDMPGHHGVPLLHKIAPGLPVIVTAAENTKELEAQVREQQVVYYYVKSFDREELLEAVREALVAPSRTQVGTMGKVLVIDDDRDYQEAIRTILVSGGYDVVSAYNKEEGKTKLTVEDPDLVVLDIMMETPTSGFHFLYETRDGETKKRIPVLAVTAVSEKYGFRFSPRTDEDYFPVDDYLDKPVKAEELLAKVGELLGGSQTV